MQLSECYRLMGVPRNATLDDVKVAYRRLARKYHPDINQNDPAAAEKFRQIQEAYQILKDADAGILPNQQPAPKSPPSPQPTPSPQPRPSPAHASVKHEKKVRVEVKNVRDVRTKSDPIANDPELKLKLDTLHRLQELLKQRKYIVAIAIVEGMAQRFPNSPEIIHWQAVTYYRWGSELLLAGKLQEARIYLNKALNTDPRNRELVFEVRRDLERLESLK